MNSLLLSGIVVHMDDRTGYMYCFNLIQNNTKKQQQTNIENE
jgi:hypothetical protein